MSRLCKIAEHKKVQDNMTPDTISPVMPEYEVVDTVDIKVE